jgi:hypothetical protein
VRLASSAVYQRLGVVAHSPLGAGIVLVGEGGPLLGYSCGRYKKRGGNHEARYVLGHKLSGKSN